MFFNAHSFVASNISASKSEKLLIGSILPDIAVTGIISWEDGLHNKKNINRFKKYLSEKYNNDIDLGVGVEAHFLLDFYTHKRYKNSVGYAFQNNKKLKILIKDYYDVNEEKSSLKAHNYIESAVDYLIVKKDPNIQFILKKAISNCNLENLSEIMAGFFKVNESEFNSTLAKYFKLIMRNDFSIISGWIELWSDLEILMNLKNISKEKKEELLLLGVESVENTYVEFLFESEVLSKRRLYIE